MADEPLAERGLGNTIFDTPWSDFEEWVGGVDELIELVVGKNLLVAEIVDNFICLQGGGRAASAR